MHKKYYSLIGILAILGCWLIWAVIRPASGEIKNSKINIGAEKDNLRELLSLGQNIVTNQKNLATIETGLQEIGDPFLAKGNELGFITDLEKIAAENGVEQEIVFGNSAEQPAEIKKVPMEIRLEGNLHNLMKYINNLEKLDYYINIRRLNISVPGTERRAPKSGQAMADNDENANEGNTEPNLVLNLSIVTYWK